MLEPILKPTPIRPFIKPLIIQILVASLFLYLTMPPVKAQGYNKAYMIWDFENNVNSWGGGIWFPVSPTYPNGRSGENSTVQYKEGNWSCYFKADASLGSDGWHANVVNGTIDTYDWHFFFWLYMTSASESGSYTGMALGLECETPEMYWLVGFEPQGTGFRVNGYVGNVGVTTYERFDEGTTELTMATWYAFWLAHNYTATATNLYWSTDAENWNLELSTMDWESVIPTKFRIEHQDNQHILYGYIDYLIVTDTAGEMYPPPPPPPPLISYIDEYFGLGLFLGGIIMMVFAPSWVAWKIKKSGVTPETVERFGYGMLLFLVGLGLFIIYIYGTGAT